MTTGEVTAAKADPRAAAVSRILAEVIDHNLDVDANAILGPLNAPALTAVLADLHAHAEREPDPFKRFRAFMILFGVYHRDAPEDGGTVYIRTAAAPDAARAQDAFARAQAAYVKGISRKLDDALRANGLAYPAELAAYRLRIPPALRTRALQVKTGVRVELDSCVGNDHVLVSQEIGAEIIHVSILLKDADTGRYDYPIRVTVRRLDQPVLRLASVDKQTGTVEVSRLDDVFDVAPRGVNEWVRLSKAAVIAAGIVPYAARHGAAHTLADYLDALGGGLEIITEIRGIPVGSGLGTSSAIAAAIVAALVKFTGQTATPETAMSDEEKMLAVARVLLVEQLIGALGGWQDPCAIFPGVKLLSTRPGDFLPVWRPILMPEAAIRAFSRHLRLTDGAYRQPSHAAAWQFTGLWAMRLQSVYEARMRSRRIVKQQVANLEAGNLLAVGPLESEDWLNRCAISPKATNPYIEQVVALIRGDLGAGNVDYDACGARGGAGGCWWTNPATVTPERFESAFVRASLQAIEMFKDRIRFEGRPHVYDFCLNEKGLEITVE